MKVANQLKKYRSLSGLSIVDCAGKVGVSQSTYRDWENGRSISGEPYVKIAKVLGVSLSELFGLTPKMISSELNSIEIELGHLRDHIKNIRSYL